MTSRDPRYDYIKLMIAEGKIESFIDIFKYVPKSIVARDIGKKIDRFTELMHHVEDFTNKELFMIAKLCDINEAKIVELMLTQYLKKKIKVMTSNASF